MLYLIIGGAEQGKLDLAGQYYMKQTGNRPQVLDAAELDCSDSAVNTILKNPLIDNLHLYIRKLLKNCDRSTVDRLIDRLIIELRETNKPPAEASLSDSDSLRIIILDDIGSGLVPLEAEDRIWRELCGRTYCRLTSIADRVDRVWAGLPQTLKNLRADQVNMPAYKIATGKSNAQKLNHFSDYKMKPISDNPYSKILLLRHGTTAANLASQYSGKRDHALTVEGMSQAVRLSQKVNELGLLHDRTDVFCSPLLRCRQTAQVVWPRSQLLIEQSYAETDFGKWEGQTWQDLQNDPLYQQWLDAAPYNRPAPPDGESGENIIRRIHTGWEACLRRQLVSGADTLAIVTHGGIIMYLMTLLTGSPDQFYDWQLKTACGWLITEGGIELVSAD